MQFRRERVSKTLEEYHPYIIKLDVVAPLITDTPPTSNSVSVNYLVRTTPAPPGLVIPDAKLV